MLDIEYIAHRNAHNEMMISDNYNINETPIPTKIVNTRKFNSPEKTFKYKLGGEVLEFYSPFSMHTFSDLWINLPDYGLLVVVDSMDAPFSLPFSGGS